MIKKWKKLQTIRVRLYISTILYEDSEILASVRLKYRKCVSYNNPSEIINETLLTPGEELENPISDAYDYFIDDCKFGIVTSEFEMIYSERIDVSDKSEYTLIFGVDNKPCGKLIYDFKVLAHPLRAL